METHFRLGVKPGSLAF